MHIPPDAAANKSVSLVIPLTAVGGLSIAQLLLGTSPAIVVMCVVAVILPFLILGLYGRDLYGLLGISFSIKYVGFALAAKTFYGQNLESHLREPYAAYGLTLLIMLSVTAMLIAARALDSSKNFFSFPLDLVSLRRLSVICICAGIAGNAFVASSTLDMGDAASGGAARVLGGAFREFYYLGLIAETFYAVTKTGGRSFVTVRLVFLFLLLAIISVSFNERGGLVTGLIGVVTVAFMYNTINFRHVFIGILACSFFMFIFTPITIYLRLQRTGLNIIEFTELAGDTIFKAATDLEFFKLILDTHKGAFQNWNDTVPYDYYGIRSEALERLSFVSLVDAVYDGTKTREPLGMQAVDQMLARNAPGFLGYNKDISYYGPGDWLSWETGLSEPGSISFTVFGLPMEGLASWGVTGVIVYPFIFMLPVIYICGRLSSFRLPLPLSIFLFVIIQHFFLEATSDGFLSWVLRNLPVLLLCLFVLHYILRSRAVLLRGRALEARLR